MNVVLFGGTGMVGTGALLECLDDPRVSGVLVIGRRGCGHDHPKLREVLHADFFDYSAIADDLSSVDACFFCLGVPSSGKTEEQYSRLTYDLTLAAAEALLAANPAVTFLYISAAGADRSEQGRSMWARVRGRLENTLLDLPFRAAHVLRPGYIQPMRGARSNVWLYRAVYTIVGWTYPVLRRLLPHAVTSTVTIGRALIHIAAEGWHEPVLEAKAINAAGRASEEEP